MRSLPFPKILVFTIICTFLAFSSLLGQKKAAAEVDVAKSWSYPLVNGEEVASDGSHVYLASAGAKVEALSLDGKKIWLSEFGGQISSNIIATESSVFLVTTTVSGDAAKLGGSKLRTLSKETGITNWTVALPDSDKYFLRSVNGMIIVISGSGVIEEADAKDGGVKWKREIVEDLVAEPEFTVTDVIVATNGGQILRLSMATGEIISTRKAPFRVTSLAEADGDLIVGDERGNLSYYGSGTDRADWIFKSGGEVSYVLPVNGNVLAASHDNFIYFLARRNGDRVWKKRLSGRVAQIATVPNRYSHFALAATPGEQRVEVIDLTTGKVAGQIALEEEESVVASPVILDTGVLFLLTNEGLRAYSSAYFARK